MVTGKTRTGFEFEVSENLQNNMELVDTLAELDEGNTLAVSKLCLLIFGKDQRNKLYDHLRLEDGSVPADMVEQSIMDVFAAFGDTGKN